MTLTTLYRQDGVTLLVGSTWNIGATALDALGAPVVFAPVITVTPPDGAPVVVTPVDTYLNGQWRGEYVLTMPGRHVAVLVSTVGSLAYTAYGVEVAASPLVTLADLRGADPDRLDPDDRGYLGTTSASDTEIQGALDAEEAAQRRVCRVPATYPADLKQALMRRVACNLARRPFPLAMLRGDAEAGDATVLPGRDPEVRRLEGPYRRLPIG